MAAHGWLWGCLLFAGWGFLVLGQEKIEVLENKGVSLPCKAIQSQPNPTRQEWKFQRDGITLLFYHGNKFTDNYKDRATFTPYEIHLTSVTRKDSGLYTCEVLGDSFSQSQVQLVVQVPAAKPTAHVPSVVTIGNKVVLRCEETEANPRPTFKWFKNDVQMPPDPKTSTIFKNSSYTIDSDTGVLAFEPAMALDTGDYSCEAENKVGPPQRSEVIHMETSELNVGGIVAGVVVLLIILGLVIFGIWFAYSRGYFNKRTTSGSKKVIYSQPSNRSDGDFKQTSSFLV
ncbi:junctional adhesion molecule A isoform X1 [Crotalus tigris]|uniref:junctional adhesion molecule A isoform X1 n=1 Tax=Crotalus tigris TaxID=88082 RepID=UPI00192F5A41|nr:junctional adhesion molecule A isoform X1 [Crotalus tigris]